MSDLDRLLTPASIALVGASESEGGYPAKILRNLRRFEYQGRILPVNPRRETVFGLPCFPSLADAPEVPDLALIMVPAAAVESAVEQAAALGVGAAAVYSSGFAELGEEGGQAQERLRKLAGPAGLRLLGPNSQGFFHLPSRVVASFSTVLEHGLRPSSGLAYVGQSGALGGATLGLADARGLGVSSWFSTGNEADLTAAEVAAVLLDDPGIEVVVIHLESVPEGGTWLPLMAALTASGKRIVCVRSGTSAAGRRAAASHTGAMVRDDAAFTLVARDHGVIVVDDIVRALDVVELLVSPRRPKGPGVGVVTTSGGGGGLAADHLTRNGLTVPTLAEPTREALAELVPAFGAVANPVDVTAQLFAGGQDRFGEVCRITADDPAVETVAVVITNLAGEEAAGVARSVVSATGGRDEPVLAVWLAPDERITEAAGILREARIPVFGSFAAAADALGHVFRDQRAASGAEPARIELSPGVAALTGALTEWNGSALLEAAGIPVPRGGLARDAGEAARIAGGLGGRLVLKIQSPDIPHKTDAGGVRVGVAPADASDAYAGILAAVAAAEPDARIDGVLVQEMAGDGVDMIVGVRGPAAGYPAVLSVGAGGVATELYRDIASATAPVTEETAAGLVAGLRSAPLLTGFRGSAPLDAAALHRALVAVSGLAAALGPRLAELEINPLRVTARGVVALDLLVRLSEEDH